MTSRSKMTSFSIYNAPVKPSFYISYRSYLGILWFRYHMRLYMTSRTNMASSLYAYFIY